ncbi:MAG: Mfa1 fimbrilin C-terminal domain-containing protein [Tidjanibacter sp.]|nr:Mfa1 fimbrilin C-terminal domain-containing protein [Tidjanibacter sp.]
MKKYFFLALAAFAFAACSEDGPAAGVNGGDEPAVSGEKMYVAVSVQSNDDSSRAATIGGYADGTADEQKVSKAIFFFFDENGLPVNVQGDKNYVTVTPAMNTQNPADDNITSLSNEILVLDQYKSQPASLVAVLNWDYTGASISHAALTDKVVATSALSSASGFIMSNSVYMDGSNAVVDRTALVDANFGKDAASCTPAKIYVERIAAKVSVTSTATKFDTSVEVDSETVYAQIMGWDLVSVQKESSLVKKIDNTWTEGALGFAWNNPTFYRSHWADANSDADAPKFVYDNLAESLGATVYVGEQTDGVNRTMYIVKAKLVDENDATVEIAKWYGTEYAGISALKTAVANSLSHKFYLRDGDAAPYTYSPISADQIDLVQGTAAPGEEGVKTYEVYFTLASGVSTANWFTYNGVDYAPVADINAELAKIDPAKVWANGEAYYFAEVMHHDTTPGIVRNHSYAINIKGVKGLGTPVYDGSENIDPTVPSDDNQSYISAEINVLAWSLVNNDVTLGQ